MYELVDAVARVIEIVIQKYVYSTVSQTPVFPMKPQKEVYFFLGHPVCITQT